MDTIEVVGPVVEGLPVSLAAGAVFGTVVDLLTSNLFVSVATFNNGGATSAFEAVARLRKAPKQSGVFLYAEGLRSAYEPNVFLSGDLILIVSGANLNSGPRSISCTKSVSFEMFQPSKVIHVEQGRFYGHANRARGQGVLVGPRLSDQQARDLAPGIALPLFRTAEAIDNKTVVGNPTGAVECTPTWFAPLRGNLMGVEEDRLEGTSARGYLLQLADR
ncbi:unnamed protein product [Agarophyton chilense]